MVRRWARGIMSSQATSEVRLRDGGSLGVRHDWQRREIVEIYRAALPELIYRAQTVHRQWHAPDRVQTCQLLSIKTGGCPEDCGYCPQSAHYSSPVKEEPLMDVDAVLANARKAREAGSTRFCMGAAWRGATDGPEFDRVVETVKGVRELGPEA